MKPTGMPLAGPVGLPVIAPLPLFKLSPAGKAPELIRQVHAPRVAEEGHVPASVWL